MSDVDPRLEGRLRSFLDEIKGQPLPPQLAHFTPATVRSGRKVLNVLAGAVAVAVVAATVAVFGIELHGRHGAGSPTPAGKSEVTSTPKPTPTSTSTPLIPAAANSLPSGAKVLIPPTHGKGTKTLGTVTLGPNEGIWIEYSCSSGDSTPFNSIVLSGKATAFLGPNNSTWWLHEFSTPNRCSGSLSTDGGQGGPLTVRFNAAHPTVTWMIVAYEYPSPAGPVTTFPSYANNPNYPGSMPPFFGELGGPAPAGAKVLIKVTYGSGSATLPTVTVTPHEPLIIEEGCISTSASANVLTIGSGDPAFNGALGIGSCYYGASAGGSGVGPVGSGAGGRLTLHVTAPPSLHWVILVYEGGSTSAFGPPT
jgi:hypothetical protein